MYLKDLHILNFKSWEEAKFDFSPKLNCFVGLNGSGKTNLLDAIHYLSLTKSYFSSRDNRSIKNEADFFMIEANLHRKEEEVQLYCALKKGQKKVFRKDKKEYEKLADHIGYFPAVVISPYDRDLITDTAEIRRRFTDNVISQGNATYLHHLMRYNKALQQRNSLLKFFAANHKFDADSLEIYDHQLAEHGEYIYQHRLEFAEALKPRIQHYYEFISQGREEASIEYLSQRHEASFEDMLWQTRSKDRVLQYTSAGVHRDDLTFKLNGDSIKHYGSQGQQKSLLIALKLAQYEFIRDHQQLVPVLLLDDIFDKLDEKRVATLVKLVHDEDFGQIFITDTHPERTVDLVKQIDANAKIFEI